MRPLELTVEGFRSYRGRATFDWRDRRLVGVVGPIGSGKSSILDAMTFALYGKTPTYEAATRSLIHQQLDQGHVELLFSVDGQVWRAARALRRKGQSGHQLERLASDDADAERTSERATRRGRSLAELYDSYYRREHGQEEPPADLLDLLRGVLDEAEAADASA